MERNINSMRVRHREIYIVSEKVEDTHASEKGAGARVRRENRTRVHVQSIPL